MLDLLARRTRLQGHWGRKRPGEGDADVACRPDRLGDPGRCSPARMTRLRHGLRRDSSPVKLVGVELSTQTRELVEVLHIAGLSALSSSSTGTLTQVIPNGPGTGDTWSEEDAAQRWLRHPTKKSAPRNTTNPMAGLADPPSRPLALASCRSRQTPEDLSDDPEPVTPHQADLHRRRVSDVAPAD